jgi:hypothetical protein
MIINANVAIINRVARKSSTLCPARASFINTKDAPQIAATEVKAINAKI